MLSNPFSRPTRTIVLILIFLLAGILFYHPTQEHSQGFPHLDTESIHQYLNRSDHAQKPLAFMSRLQKQLRPSACIPDTTVISSTKHHYRTETKTATKTILSTTTLQPTCDPIINSPMTSKEDATQEQLTIAKLRDEGIVIIFKTGAQEVSHLAIQVGTTLRYMSANDILFFSDLQGSIGPFLVNDALRNVDQKMKKEDKDFEIYRQIKEYQSTGQDILDLQDQKHGADRPGWRLDKYKFIHMVEETFEMRPDAKWYVFIETDSYVFWDNLAEWLKRLDSTKPWYIGSQVSSGTTNFAHGGSGYILSNAAMNKLLGPEQPQGLAASWDERMKSVPYGDLALGIALQEKGVKLSVAHPLLNGYKPTTFTYGPGNHWCQPVVTMHHILPAEVSSVWRYERRRELLGMANTTLFADLYMHFVEPHLLDSRDNWDNLSHGPEYSQAALDKKKKAKDDEEKKKQDASVTEKKEAESATKEGAKVDEVKDDKTNVEPATESKDVKAVAEEKDEKKETTEKDSAAKAKEIEKDTKDSKSGAEKDVEASVSQDEKVDTKKPIMDAAKSNDVATGDTKIQETQTSPTADLKVDEPKKDAAKQDVKDAGMKMGDQPVGAENKDAVKEDEVQKLDTKAENSQPSWVEVMKDEFEKKNEKDDLTNSPNDGKETTEGPPAKISIQDTKTEAAADETETSQSTEDATLQQLKDNSPLHNLSKRTEPEPELTEIQKHAHESFENCGKACEEAKECFQWVYYDKTCKLGMTFRLGKYVKPSGDGKVVWKSGWMMPRIRKWTDENACTNPKWLDL